MSRYPDTTGGSGAYQYHRRHLVKLQKVEDDPEAYLALMIQLKIPPRTHPTIQAKFE